MKNTRIELALAVLLVAVPSARETLFGADLPDSSLNLRLEAPISTWDEAIPLGNGLMGVLVWGEKNTIRFSLDRGDLWDERPSKAHVAVKDKFNWASMQRMVSQDSMEEFNSVFDSNYDYDGPPTKLPAGRVEVFFSETAQVKKFELDLAAAEGIATFADGTELRIIVDAANVRQPVAFARIVGAQPGKIQVRPPKSLAKLGYAPARMGQTENSCWFEQECADGFVYAVYAAWKSVDKQTELAITVATNTDGPNAMAVAQDRVQRALSSGYSKISGPHRKWWTQFWKQSSVFVPEPHILKHYYLVRYFYGAASRRGAPPVPLQGVWTADTETLPPWKGDYHNDLNTQMTYMGYQAAGHFEEGAAFLDMLWDLLPKFRDFAKEFYHAPGAAVPGVMTLKGQALGGWGQYSLSPTMGAWIAHLFYLHWRYTGDDGFLCTRAYPWCREIGECLMHLLKPDETGVLKLPLSSSPEIFDNTRDAFVKPNSNYDLMCMKMLFLALAEMAAALGDASEAHRWSMAANQLGDYHVDSNAVLLIAADTPLPSSHRHLSNLVGIYPFNLLTIAGSERDKRIIEASLKHWDTLGTSAWCGYSFSWMSALRARIGDGESAVRNLDIFTKAFVLRNGFHANGDQTKSGFSQFTYRPFTLEGNFLAMAAVHEMLIQSWASNPGNGHRGIIRIFPATPWRWHNAWFDNLRAEGGHAVSARRENNAITWLRIIAGCDGPLQIHDNFGNRKPSWNRNDVRKVGNHFEVIVKRGDVVEASLPKPLVVPPPPPNHAEPVLIRKHATTEK